MAQIGSLLKEQYLPPAKKQSKNRPNTVEWQAVEKMENEIENMEKECALYNNPEHFSKFGKL